MSEPPPVRFGTATEWAQWLAEFHTNSPGIWLEIGKAGRGLHTVSYAEAALDADPAARAFFATLDSRNRYAILHRVQAARRPETRARRIAKYVAMLHNGERLHP
jgi:uncharacterized protein YdeI (YjbR/CyaY-like superfamily)